jgi:hypothetical protein
MRSFLILSECWNSEHLARYSDHEMRQPQSLGDGADLIRHFGQFDHPLGHIFD